MRSHFAISSLCDCVCVESVLVRWYFLGSCMAILISALTSRVDYWLHVVHRLLSVCLEDYIFGLIIRLPFSPSRILRWLVHLRGIV
jgi:hypothetical protein